MNKRQVTHTIFGMVGYLTLRTLGAIALVCVASLSQACLWDRDTLANEVGEFPEVVDVATGRFVRNPLLFYEMRLQRSLRKLEKEPHDLAIYDDASVALDRLGRSDEAIVLIQKKLPHIAPSDEEHLYRYHANIGTFWAHRWAKTTDKKRDIQWLENGIRHIGKALEINPEAHFGRERVQLWIMEWARDETIGDPEVSEPLSAYLERANNTLPVSDDGSEGASGTRASLFRGLMGLVVLGNAWESVDVFLALAEGDSRQGVQSYMFALRIQELERAGRKTLQAKPPKLAELGLGSMAVHKDVVEEQFRILRKHADAWHAHRQEFMLAKLERGEHPDTHPEFWEDYAEKPRPELPVPLKAKYDWPQITMWVVIAGLLLLPVAVAAMLIVWYRRRRRGLSIQ